MNRQNNTIETFTHSYGIYVPITGPSVVSQWVRGFQVFSISDSAGIVHCVMTSQREHEVLLPEYDGKISMLTEANVMQIKIGAVYVADTFDEVVDWIIDERKRKTFKEDVQRLPRNVKKVDFKPIFPWPEVIGKKLLPSTLIVHNDTHYFYTRQEGLGEGSVRFKDCGFITSKIPEVNFLEELSFFCGKKMTAIDSMGELLEIINSR